jgi:hypothetical protein
VSFNPKKLADVTIKVFLSRWSSAVNAQLERIIEKRTRPRSRAFNPSGEYWSDVAFLLESMCQFYKWLDIAKERWPIMCSLQQPDPRFISDAKDLRKMFIHADEFLIGDGRGAAQDRFIASTPFGHGGTDVMWADNALSVGGRLYILDAAHDIKKVAKILDQNGYFMD